MNQQRTPMRWPATWKDPAALGLLKGTGIDCLIFEEGADLGPVSAAAARMGPAVGNPAGAHTRIVKGEWPGVRMSAHGSDQADAGPTGVPWVDSNGWKIRLEAALHPGAGIYVDARPAAAHLAAGAYALAVADAAAHGGAWIVALDDALAAGIASGQQQALARWKEIGAATAFFAGHAAWRDYDGRAVLGVVSDFTGRNEFLAAELLNLLARANQQYRIVVTGAAPSFAGLRALLCADAAPPTPELRRAILAFVEAGGLLIAGPKWGAPPAVPARDPEHPRYDIRAHGKGRIALARTPPDDPYILANDSLVLVSHRYELVRFWNAGAVGAYLTAARSGQTVVAHLLFYSNWGPRDMSVRIAGQYRAARLWTLDRSEPRSLELHKEKDGTELHLPPLNQYAALELEV